MVRENCWVMNLNKQMHNVRLYISNRLKTYVASVVTGLKWVALDFGNFGNTIGHSNHRYHCITHTLWHVMLTNTCHKHVKQVMLAWLSAGVFVCWYSHFLAFSSTRVFSAGAFKPWLFCLLVFFSDGVSFSACFFLCWCFYAAGVFCNWRVSLPACFSAEAELVFRA